MHTVSWGLRSWSVMGALALAGCATLPPTPTESRSASVEGVSYASLDDAMQALAEDSPGGRTPRVHLYVPSATPGTNRFIDANIRVDEDAYVVVLAVDLDSRVRVLYPEDPEDLGFVSKSQTQHLSRFFAGFGSVAGSAFTYASYGSVAAARYRRGAVFALASDRPFQLDRIVDRNGDWDENVLSRILFTSNTSYSLGIALTMTGQHFTSDESTFAGSQGFSSFASQSFGGCGYGDGFYDSGFENPNDTFGFSRPLVQYFVRGNTLYASYAQTGGCGGRFYSQPIPIGPATDPRAPRDTTKRDSSATVNPARIAAHSSAERAPASSASRGGGTDENSGRRIGGYRVPGAERGSDTRERPVARPAEVDHRMWQSHDRPTSSPNGEARATNPQMRSEPAHTEPVHAAPAVAPAVASRPQATP